jgi:hypothetical protein
VDDLDGGCPDNFDPNHFDPASAINDFFFSDDRTGVQVVDPHQTASLEARQMETFQTLFSQFCNDITVSQRTKEHDKRLVSTIQALEAFLIEHQLEVCIVTALKEIGRGTELLAEYSMNHDGLQSFGVLKPPEVLVRYYETSEDRFNVGVFNNVDLNDETDVVTLSWASPYEGDDNLYMSKADYLANRLVTGRTLPRPRGGFAESESANDSDSMDFRIGDVVLDGIGIAGLDDIASLDIACLDSIHDLFNGRKVNETQEAQEAHENSSDDDDLPISRGKSGYKGVYPSKKRFKCRITIKNQHNQDPFEGRTFASAIEAAKSLREWRRGQNASSCSSPQ